MIPRPGSTLRAKAAVLGTALIVLAGCSSGAEPASGGADATGAPPTTAIVVPQGFGTVTLVVTRPDGTTEEWCVWLADTPTLRSRGLMGVTATDLGGAPAMVFRFDDDTTAGFWMRSTLLPLSVAWYSSDGALVSSTDMAPCPVGETDCPVYDPAGAYRVAIEVPQGGLGAVGLVAGSMIELGREGCSVAAA